MCARLLRSISPLLPPSFPPSRPLILNPFTVLHRGTTRELGSCGYLSVQTYCSRGFDVVPPYRGTTRFCPLYTVWLNMWCLNNLPNPNDQIHTFRVFEQLDRCVSICTFIKSRPEDICCTFKFVDVLQYSECTQTTPLVERTCFLMLVWCHLSSSVVFGHSGRHGLYIVFVII